MNAIQMLIEDHVHFHQLLQDLRDTTPTATQKRRDLAMKIRADLRIHATIEEEIFYPAIRKASGGEMDTLYFQALEEHRTVQDLLLPDLLRTDPGSSRFMGRVNVLKEVLELHIHEEEQDIFTHARSMLSADELRELGHQMVSRRTELLADESHPALLSHPLEAMVRIGDKIVRTGSSVLREVVGVGPSTTTSKKDRDKHEIG